MAEQQQFAKKQTDESQPVKHDIAGNSHVTVSVVEETDQPVMFPTNGSKRMKLYDLQSSIKEKITASTKSDTKFYDVAQPYGVLKKVNVRVTPQLEEINFYCGSGIPDQQDYAPVSYKALRQRESKVRQKVKLSQILNYFDEGQICFVGPAGSGKTTLLKAISRDVMEGKYENLKDIEIVHFVKCRGFRASDKVTPAELLFRNVNPKLNKDEMNGSLEFAKRHPNKVLFVIDSLDTLPSPLDGEHDVIGLHEEASPATILWNLFTNKLIPGSRSITSSRQHTIRKYVGDLRANKVIALAGLTEESMKQIIIGYLDKREAEKKMSYLRLHPLLMSLCETPVFLVFTLIGWNSDSDFTPSTMSGIMVLLLQSLVRSEHAHAENIEDVINKLKELAFTGTKEGVLFQTHELAQYKPEEEEVTDVTNLGGGRQRLLEEDSILFFSHQSIQETLTAFHIAEMELNEFEAFVEKHLHTPRYCVVRRFLCGIMLDKDVKNAAGQLLKATEDFQAKKTLLLASLNKQVSEVRKSADQLELLISMYEARYAVTEGVKMKKINLCGIPLMLSDIHAVGSVMHHYSLLESVTLSNCNLHSGSLKVLASSLRKSYLKISKLELEVDSFDTAAVTNILDIVMQCLVEELVAEKKDGHSGMKFSRTTLRLEFWSIPLTESAMSRIGSFIGQCQVNSLELRNCKLTSKLSETLFKSSIGNAKVEKLNLDRPKSDVTTEDIQALREILPCVTRSLVLEGWEATEEQKQIILQGINLRQLTELAITGTSGAWDIYRSTEGSIQNTQDVTQLLPDNESESETDEEHQEHDTLSQSPLSDNPLHDMNTNSLAQPRNRTENNELGAVSGIKLEKRKDKVRATWRKVDGEQIEYLVQVYCDQKDVLRDVTHNNQFDFATPHSCKEYHIAVWSRNQGVNGKKATSEKIIRYRKNDAGNGIKYDSGSPLRCRYTVYRGEQDSVFSSMDVAVKVISDDSIAKEKLEREVKAMSGLRHPNIVSYITSGKMPEGNTGPQTYIAMELCDSKTLLEIIQNEKQVKEHEHEQQLWFGYRKTILLQIMHGLKYVHSNQSKTQISFIHRDLKPQNILRSLDKRNMKLADFGHCKPMDVDKSKTNSTIEVGTDGWRSPEHNIQANGASMSVKSDIYSAGLVSYYVLSNGKHAIGQENASWKQNIFKNVGMDLSGLECLDEEIARDLITKMLEKEPSNRPSAKEVLEHPFFWNCEKKLKFLCDVSDTFDAVRKTMKPGDPLAQERAEPKSIIQEAKVKLGDGWLLLKLDFLNDNSERFQPLREAIKKNDRVDSVDSATRMIDPETVCSNLNEINGWLDKMQIDDVEGPVYERANERFKNGTKRYDHASVISLLRFIRNLCHHYKDDVKLKGIFKKEQDIWKFISPRFPNLFSFIFSLMKDTTGFEEYSNKEAKNMDLPGKQEPSTA